jgi:membrane protein DedA with SNARE-associated domain
VNDYIAHYGYAAIIAGTFFEGETTVLLGGIFSKLAYMDISRVMLSAFTGTLLGDCTFFFLGKYLGRNFIGRYDFLRSRIPLANRIMRRYGNFILFLVRFFVGVRGIILLLLGCTDIKKRTFFLYSTLSALIWSVAVALMGYLFGEMVYVFAHDVRKYEVYMLPAVLVGVILLILVYRHLMKEGGGEILWK